MAKPPASPPARRRIPREPGGRAVRLVLTTTPPRAAAGIARALVEAGVAACVNAIPGVRSTYRWKGRVERATETLLVVKTTKGALPACRRALGRLHPYDVPEIVVVRPDAVEASYADWVIASTR